MSEFYTRGEVALWLQPDGPNTAPVYLGCHQLDSITEPLGENTLIRRPDPSRPNLYRTIGKVKAPPDLVTFSVQFRVQEALDYLETVGCPVTVFAHLRKCGRADLFTNYERTFILQGADVVSRGIENLAALEANDATVNASADFQADPPVLRVKGTGKILAERLTTTEVRNALYVWFYDTPQCADSCGASTPGCRRGFVSTAAPAGSASGVARVLYTTDGNTWTATGTNPFAAAEDAGAIVAFYVGAQTVRVVVARGEADAGNPAEIAYSDDTGTTWTNVNVGSTNGEYIRCLWAVDAAHIWAGTSSGNIYTSTDGGATWTLQTALGWTAVNGIHFTDALTGVAVGNGSSSPGVAYTTNGGLTWQGLTTVPGSAELGGVWVLDGKRWWVQNSDGALYYTTDGGATWTARTAPVTGLTAGGLNLQFVNDLIGYALFANASGSHLARTIDGGYTWELITIPTNSGVYSLWACGPNEFHLVGLADGGTAYLVHGA